MDSLYGLHHLITTDAIDHLAFLFPAPRLQMLSTWDFLFKKFAVHQSEQQILPFHAHI